ncbi:hypothetical protein [Pseudoalteromonas sp. B160]|uniref:hypothetical protein n=1 Tax=Pseudoalteromonas sp. B160 TaxID=630414 RepID=UPI00301DBFF6
MVCGPREIATLRPYYDPKKQFLAVTFNYSGYAMVRELKHLINSGKLGTIQKIHLEMPQEGFRRPPISREKHHNRRRGVCEMLKYQPFA